MTDRPILFNGPMVRAILDGRKTQTRRVLKQQPLGGPHHSHPLSNETRRHRLGYGPGDRLWVREAHYMTNKHAYRLSVGVDQRVNPANDYDACVFKEGFDRSTGGLRVRPSIHMPRWASRLTLVVTDVRVERVQDISKADAISEGCRPFFDEGDPHIMRGPNGHEHSMAPLKGPIDDFQRIWKATYGPDAWHANPWVTAITFDTHRCNIDDQVAT